MLKVDKELLKHRADFLRSINNRHYEVSDDGIYMPDQKAMISGAYVHDVNGVDERIDKNLIVTEGLDHILDVVFHQVSAVSTWYLTVFAGNVTVLPTWNASNFYASANEIATPAYTQGVEGYSESTRPAFNEGAASGGSINNTSNKAAFNIVTASSVVVWGAAMLSSEIKGGSGGKLMSASKFAQSRTLFNTDVLNVGYTITLTST